MLKKQMKTYELTYIVTPEMTTEEALAKAKEIESAIQNKEGIILRQSNPIAKTLAYPVGRRASGFFGVLEFQLEPEKLVELKEIVEKDGKIVRHMVIIKEPLKIKRERGSKIKPQPEGSPILETEQKTETESIKETKTAPAKTTITKEKVELKDIEEKLDEILGE